MRAKPAATLFSQITVEHGPAELLGRTLLLCEAELRERLPAWFRRTTLGHSAPRFEPGSAMPS